jgi:hypothetical protein
MGVWLTVLRAREICMRGLFRKVYVAVSRLIVSPSDSDTPIQVACFEQIHAHSNLCLPHWSTNRWATDATGRDGMLRCEYDLQRSHEGVHSPRAKDSCSFRKGGFPSSRCDDEGFTMTPMIMRCNHSHFFVFLGILVSFVRLNIPHMHNPPAEIPTLNRGLKSGGASCCLLIRRQLPSGMTFNVMRCEQCPEEPDSASSGQQSVRWGLVIQS